MRIRELVQDHDAGGKLSAARAPLMGVCAVLFAAWMAAGVIIVVTYIQEPETGYLTWDVLQGWFEVGIGALWPLVASYVGGKGMGRIWEKEGGE